MAIELFQQHNHRCLAFQDLVPCEGGVQSNQFLIIHGEHEALIDPGGELTYNALSMEIGKQIRIRDLDYVLASHQDPDIITSLPRWLTHTNCTIAASERWIRFLPHLIPGYIHSIIDNRTLPIPDKGLRVPLGDSEIIALPAHFLHSVGNFQFYDPVSKILFSGDMGASIGTKDLDKPVEDFQEHIPGMLSFHQRYMCASKACRLWANMVKSLDVEMMVPQHGRFFKGREMIHRFLNWISHLQCGVDLLNQANYQIPPK